MTSETICVRTQYEYRPDADEPCIAVMQVELPTNEHGTLLQVLRSVGHVVCGEHLRAYWGDVVEGAHGRARTIKVSGSTWDETVERVRAAREEAVGTLREVIARNKAMARAIPAPEATVVYIDYED